jgi:hypothetical protein
MHEQSNSALDLLKMTMLATAVAGLLYYCYFQLAPWIWSQNQPFRPEEITVWQLLWLEDRDGIELYALYVLMFLDIFIVYFLSSKLHAISGGYARYFLILLIVVACAYIGSIGFHPPMSNFHNRALTDIFSRSMVAMFVVLPVTALLYYLQKRSAYLALAAVSLLLIPICFMSTAPIEWYDYSFILSPSLSLLQGASVSDVYLPYDLLLSWFGLAWMKLQLDLNSFQIVGQFSYYLLLLGTFAFSMRWFLDKRLSVFLLIALVMVRIYAGPFDAVRAFQLTPLRIDLWLILLMLVYFKGPYHLGLGISCGLLLLLHNKFGIIYTAAYIQLLLTLCVLDADMFSGRSIKTVSTAFGTLIKRNSHNFALILLGACAHYLLIKGANESGNFSFESLRISFTKISENSFYWYVVIVSGMSFTLLLRLRSMISGNYLAAGLFLVFLAIGNSLYFFGHSHENAIIVLSSILLLLFFLMLDLVGRYLCYDSKESKTPIFQRNLAIIVSLVLISSVTIWYGDNITRKAAIQARNAAKGQLIYPSEVPQRYVLNTIKKIRQVTGNSSKVYFVGDYDLLFYYFGKYAQVGYYNPVYSWISRNEFNKFLQGLMDQGYYLVVDNGLVNVLSSIRFSNSKNVGERWVIWK